MTNPVQQSGSITPGNLAKWVTTGVIADAGSPIETSRILAVFPSANFNDTSDQPLGLPAAITAFQLNSILITNATVSLTTAVGGFYPGAGKTGTPIVAAGQVYSSLTGSTKLLSATLAAAVATTLYTRANLPLWEIFFSLTTAQGAAAAADIYIIGTDLSL